MVDVNGNPQTLDLSNYHQLRSSSSSNTFGHGVTPLGANTNSSSAANHDNSQFEVKKRQRDRKKQREKSKLVQSDQCQNYKGEQDLGSLLRFIEGSNASTAPAQALSRQSSSQEVKKDKSKKKSEKRLVSKERQNESEKKSPGKKDGVDLWGREGS